MDWNKNLGQKFPKFLQYTIFSPKRNWRLVVFIPCYAKNETSLVNYAGWDNKINFLRNTDFCPAPFSFFMLQ